MWLKTASRASSLVLNVCRLSHSFLMVAMKLSQAALSYASPRDSIEARMPQSLSGGRRRANGIGCPGQNGE